MTPRSGNAARDDQVEILEICRHVERKAVARHPSRDPHADRRQLVAADPHAGQSFDAPRLDTVVGGGPDQHLFDVAHVTMDVAPIGLQIDDRDSRRSGPDRGT